MQENKYVEINQKPIKIKITEELLREANRQQLLNKSRNAKLYSVKNRNNGKNRYERRLKSRVTASVKDYNIIDMDSFFKRDQLTFGIPVEGETDVYVVTVEIKGVLAEIQKAVKVGDGKLEFKTVLSSLSKILNTGDVSISCTCPDAIYRQAYWQTQRGYKAGYKETRASNITNPNDDLGAGCKHVILVLSNLSWMVKVASVINNYIKYSREHLQRNYTEYIFPKVFGMKYDKAVQLQLFYQDEESGLLPSDSATISKAIEMGFKGKDSSGKFAKGNEFRFQKKAPEEPVEDDEGEDFEQMKLF